MKFQGVRPLTHVVELLDPWMRKTWSGPTCVLRHVVLTTQVVQPTPKPPPGFCQAAREADSPEGFCQNHWPLGVKSIRAWTDIQYWPGVRLTAGEIVITAS